MTNPYPDHEQAEAAKFAHREADWRNGAIVYQVIVDRFSEPTDLASKRHLYAYPRKLHAWSEDPSRGYFLPEHHVYSHEIDFWGGDLPSLRANLDYIAQLEVDVLYLNPIHSAFTNHKYDASDYFAISPEYGTLADLDDLIADTHQRGMHILLDGVFNHIGRGSPIFQQAAADADSPYRDWFYFGGQYSKGVRLWANAESLPELNYENPAVRDFIYGGENSVVRSFLRRGIDGWRLDTAFELGFTFLAELTESAHLERPGSLIVGEIWNYPQDWFPAVDSVMNFSLRQIIFDAIRGSIAPASVNTMLDRMIADAGIEPMLKSWILLDNHDVSRLKTEFPDPSQRKIAQVLQFTLPGSPNLYYGSEVGMEGAGDPAMRGPMRWDWVTDEVADYRWTKEFIRLRKSCRALKIGDFRPIVASRLIAFERATDRVAETILILANPSDQVVDETVLVPDARLQNATRFTDLLGSGKSFLLYAGTMKVSLAPKSILLLKPHTTPFDGYSPYKRMV